MAYAQVRHAAGRPTYAVYELVQGRPALDPRLHSECDGFEEAVDCALRFLDRTDPERTGRVEALEIVRREGTKRETVWTYRYEPGYLRANPLDRGGFDVTRLAPDAEEHETALLDAFDARLGPERAHGGGL
jgi:hypothetical protein